MKVMKDVRHYFVIKYMVVTEKWGIVSALHPNRRNIKDIMTYMKGTYPLEEYRMASVVLQVEEDMK